MPHPDRSTLLALTLLLPTLSISGCVAWNSPEACRVIPVAETTLRIVGNRPIVEATVEGRPARFLLDTGASGMLITEAAFARLGLTYNLAITGTSTSIGAQALSRVTNPVRLTIGNPDLKQTELKPINFIVIPSATALGESSGVDGLLGTGALASYDVDIDMPHRRLALAEPRHCPDGAPPFPGPSVTYKAPPNPYNYMYVPARIDDRALFLIADTGATRTYLSQPRLGLSDTDLAQDREIKVNSAGPDQVRARFHKFHTVQFADATWTDIGLYVGPLRAESDGLLGTDFWRTRRLWLSFAGWSITIQHTDAERPPR